MERINTSPDLPSGNVHICFSGGRTSAYMLHQLVEKNGGSLPKDWVVCFCNTGKEFPQTYDFVRDVGENLNIDIAWLEYDVEKGEDGRNRQLVRKVDYDSADRNGECFSKLVEARQTLPNPLQRFCTIELKILTGKRYCKNVLGWDTWTQAIGIRADEPLRIKPAVGKWINWFPLFLWNKTKHDVAEFWSKQKYDLKLPIHNGKTIGGNCDGCFLKSEATKAALYRRYPDRYKWWENKEAEIMKTGGKDGKGRRKKTLFCPTCDLRELREFIDKQKDMVFDQEDVLCQANGGECSI